MKILIVLLFIVLIGGGFSLSIKACNLENEKGAILFVVISLVMVVLGSVLVCALERYDNKVLWNDGLCPKCEEEWRLVDIDYGKIHNHFYYVCGNCGRYIEISK